MYWEKDLEILDRKSLEKLQVERLRDTIEKASVSPFYRERLGGAGITAGSMRSIDDIRKIPFTTKDDLRENFPYGLLAVNRGEAVRLHCSSGTTGNPTVVFHARHDLDSWANLIARSMYCAGVRPSDVFQNICGYGLFTGGLGFQYGAERLGVLTIPAGAGNTRRQIKLMRDYGTTVIHTIPSYLVRLHSEFEAMHLDVARDTELRLLLIGAEPHTEAQRLRVQEMFGINAYNSYGLSEMNGPGVAFECSEQSGMHLWEDCYVAEIIDPHTLEPVPDGEQGELVLTTLDRHAMPILRYRTRDLTRIVPGDCPCGRTHRRIDRIAGRSDDMFIIRGCNVFPMQIENVLMSFPEIGADYVIVLEPRDGVDTMRIEVEVHKEWFTDDYARLDELAKRIAHEVKSEVLVTPVVKLVSPGGLPGAEGKAVRVRDLR